MYVAECVRVWQLVDVGHHGFASRQYAVWECAAERGGCNVRVTVLRTLMVEGIHNCAYSVHVGVFGRMHSKHASAQCNTYTDLTQPPHKVKLVRE